MADKKAVEDKLRKILAESMPQTDMSKVNLNTRLREDLGLDSVRFLLLELNIEEDFGPQFDDNARFDTVGDVYEFILQHATK